MAETASSKDSLDKGAGASIAMARETIGARNTEPDEELIKLARKGGPKIGVITGLGVVILCFVFVLRLNGDRKFSGDDAPEKVSVAAIVDGKVAGDHFISVDLEPLMSHAIRAARNKTGVGLRVVPVRGASDKLWLVMNGDGWDQPTTESYQGRLEQLSDLPFADAVTEYARTHPRPVFAKAAAVRAGLAAAKVAMVTGDTFSVADADKVAIDVLDPNAATIVAAMNERFPDAASWAGALGRAGVPVGAPLAPLPNSSPDQVRFEVKGPNAVVDTTAKLEKAELWAARVEPLTRHYETTWGTLKTSPPTGFTVAASSTIPDAELDLVGFYVARGIPDGAYALITGDRPQQYWYVLPITIVLILIGLMFAWGFVLAVKRDFLGPKIDDDKSAPSAA
ncbi:MAG: hypothetical protein ACKV2T_01575 [Kofleriaceae bacterium]